MTTWAFVGGTPIYLVSLRMPTWTSTMSGLYSMRSRRFIVPAALIFCSTLLYELHGTREGALDWISLYTPSSLTPTSLWTIAPLCPSFETISSTVEVLAQEGLQCHSVHSALSEFTVKACYNLQHCGAIDFVLRRTDQNRCAEMEAKPGQLNEDPALDSWLREQVESSRCNTTLKYIMTLISRF